MRTVEITVKGRVQGVFYRDFTKRNADDLSIKGYVMNLANGDVFVVAQGDKIDDFVERLRKGPPSAKVNDVIVNDINTKETFIRFEVKYQG